MDNLLISLLRKFEPETAHDDARRHFRIRVGRTYYRGGQGRHRHWGRRHGHGLGLDQDRGRRGRLRHAQTLAHQQHLRLK